MTWIFTQLGNFFKYLLEIKQIFQPGSEKVLSKDDIKNLLDILLELSKCSGKSEPGPIKKVENRIKYVEKLRDLKNLFRISRFYYSV